MLVFGFGEFAGDFNLAIETLDPAKNDDCTDATRLDFGESELGNNFAASFSDNLPVCGL